MHPEVPSSWVAGCVEGSGQVPRAFDTSITWDFTPEQLFNPSKLTHHLMEWCLAYPNQNEQLLALYWVLACAYRTTVQYSEKTVVEAGTQTIMEDTLAETGTQTTTITVIAPVVKKKKWMRQDIGPYH
ncbi:hypothetical protein BTVI_63407 [Pitangus sulphuratus]|nr:hypothetical protein BTVI_63407 [Pitangus sulphuratus]